MDQEIENENENEKRKILVKPVQSITEDARIQLDLDDNRFMVEFRIDDIVRKLNPGLGSAGGGSCGGCTGCSGCSM